MSNKKKFNDKKLKVKCLNCGCEFYAKSINTDKCPKCKSIKQSIVYET